MAGEIMSVDGRQLSISNRDKVFFPKTGITKGDLVDYYARIGETALRYFTNRPLSMQRFPDGIAEDGFFQKDAPDYFPDWIERCRLEKEGGTVDHIVANSVATLVYIANQGCITPHLGLSRIDAIERPDRLVFDLDPADDEFRKVRTAALRLKELLGEIELAPYVQTTGSRGLHVVIPLDRSIDFDAARDFARMLCETLAARHPDSLTVEQRKDKRGSRVFLDYLRNAYGQTAVAPYSVRAKEGAPVATPLDWSEVGDSDLGPRKYTIGNVFRRLAQKDDPWRTMARRPQSLRKARELLTALKR